MALKISKYSFSVRKYIQFFISAPIEKRLLLMLSEENLKFIRKLQRVKGKGVAVLGFRLQEKKIQKNYLSISMRQFVLEIYKKNSRPSTVTRCRR